MTAISLDHAQRELARAIRAWQFDPENVDLEKNVIYWREEVRRLQAADRKNIHQKS